MPNPWSRPVHTVAATLILAAAWTGARADLLAMRGPELYSRYCAACHGKAGQGDGPVAGSFKVAMPDLTLIARRQGGKFPREQITKIIDGRYMLLAHGSREMPIWGEGFAHQELGNPDANRVVDVVIGRLVDHLETLQRPVPRPAD